MESESLDRRLAAILSADAVAYSWLMARDEETTVATLKRHRNAMMSLVRQHRGRVVDDLADGLLAEFPSAIDAVACAVQTQRDVEARNLEYADTPAMRFRIGVHVGEVLVDGDRLFGDAVNISARVRENADEGGVMLSGTARFHIEGRLDVTIEDLGSVSLKHIPTPVEICRVVLGEVPRENDGRPVRARYAHGGANDVMPSFLWNLANAHFMAEQYEDAVRYAEEALTDRASNFVLRSVYAAALAHAGREEKARLQVATLVEMAPTISADGVRRFMEYMSIEPGFVSRVLSGLRTGGLV